MSEDEVKPKTVTAESDDKKKEESAAWIFWVIIAALVIFNPGPGSHRKTLAEELTARVAAVPFGALSNALGFTAAVAESDQIKYHNYFLFSTTADANGKRATFGVCGLVWTTF